MIILLIFSLALNAYALWKINYLKEDHLVLKDQSNILEKTIYNAVNSSINSLKTAVRELQEEQRLVTPLDINLGERIGKEQKVELSFQVKKLAEDSVVSFYLKKPGEKEFQSLPVENTGGGRYKVEIAEEISPDPLVQIEKTRVAKDNKPVSPVKEIRYGEESTAKNYVYYISITDGENIQTTEESRFDLSKLRYIVAAPLTLRVNVLGSQDKTSLTVMERAKEDTLFKISKLFLVGEKSGEIVFNKAFVPETIEGRDGFKTTVERIGLPAFDRLFLLIEYHGQERVKKLLPPDLLL